ncbi:VTT domain-containing protein [Entamoeba marina]
MHFLPSSIISISAGFIYGWAKGSVLGVIGRALGCVIPFYLGKLFGKNQIENYLEENPKTKLLFEKLNEKGSYLICLMRICPLLPFTLSSWLLGPLTTSTNFFVGTITGVIPLMIAYSYLGAAVNQMNVLITTPQIFFTITGLSTIAFIIIIVLYTKKILKEMIDENIETNQLTDIIIIKN